MTIYNEQIWGRRTPRELAKEIRELWKDVDPEARPYLNAMVELRHPWESYGWDDGRDIIRNFLANSGKWKGKGSRRIKEELSSMVHVKLKARASWLDYEDPLRTRLDFDTNGALRGRRVGPGFQFDGLGRLDPEHQKTILNDLHGDRLNYVVWSYRTPIAWSRTDGTWIIPDEKYSMTTSRHQSLIRTALHRYFIRDSGDYITPGGE